MCLWTSFFRNCTCKISIFSTWFPCNLHLLFTLAPWDECGPFSFLHLKKLKCQEVMQLIWDLPGKSSIWNLKVTPSTHLMRPHVVCPLHSQVNTYFQDVTVDKVLAVLCPHYTCRNQLTEETVQPCKTLEKIMLEDWIYQVLVLLLAHRETGFHNHSIHTRRLNPLATRIYLCYWEFLTANASNL